MQIAAKCNSNFITRNYKVCFSRRKFCLGRRYDEVRIRFTKANFIIPIKTWVEIECSNKRLFIDSNNNLL